MDEVRIFISYAREDKARVKQLYQRLADAGFQPWLDREHIIPGMKWEPVIKKALKQSDFVLVCLSATSINKRGFLQREIKQALEQAEEKLEHDVYLIPARLDDCEVPNALSELQWVDLFEDDGWQWLLKAIEHGLKQRGKLMPMPVAPGLPEILQAILMPWHGTRTIQVTRRTLLGKNNPTRSGFTTCTATFVSGARMSFTTPTRMRQPMDQLGWVATQVSALNVMARS